MSKLPTLPEYRVRLFLSVDLSGSTAFKSNSKDLSWIRVFRSFYSSFYKIYQSEYIKYCEENEGCKEFAKIPPKIWKTVGDEVIFVSRVDNLFEIFAHVHSFGLSLKNYRKKLKNNAETSSLDVKGNGWIAAFPHPNQTISMQNSHTDGFIDEFADEAQEVAADKDPSEFEFLGPGIDAGFRISKNSTPSFFTISPALAYLLCRANTNRDYKNYQFDLSFSGVNSLKGVAKGEPYPITGINTEWDQEANEVTGLQKALLGNGKLDDEQLADYLEKFSALHGIDIPLFSTSSKDGGLSPSMSYREEFIPNWKKSVASDKSQDRNFEESAQHDGSGDAIKISREDLDSILNSITESLPLEKPGAKHLQLGNIRSRRYRYRKDD